MVELVTATEFSRRVGVTRQRVSQLIDEGKLPTVAVGRKGQRKIPWGEGKAVWDAERGIIPDLPPEPRPDALSGPAPVPANHATAASRLAQARAADKVYQAETRRLRMEELRGSLVSLADVKAEAREIGTRIRVAIQAIPARVAPLMTGETAHDEAILDTATTEALQALHEGRYG